MVQRGLCRLHVGKQDANTWRSIRKSQVGMQSYSHHTPDSLDIVPKNVGIFYNNRVPPPIRILIIWQGTLSALQ